MVGVGGWGRVEVVGFRVCYAFWWFIVFDLTARAIYHCPFRIIPRIYGSQLRILLAFFFLNDSK